VEEYLRTSYDPDCDYVDGEVIGRNVGERDHSKIQRKLIVFFDAKSRQWKLTVWPEQRIQVSARRFRVPDVCIVLGDEPDDQIFHQPPFICIEILSKDDTLAALQEKIDDFLNFGVRYVWVINPRNKRAWVYTPGKIEEVTDGVLRTENPALELPLAELF
jgi:Uma2 family endonuclease